MWNEYTATACPSIPRKGYLMLLWVPLSLPSCNQVLQIGKQTEPKPNLVCEPMVFELESFTWCLDLLRLRFFMSQ